MNDLGKKEKQMDVFLLMVRVMLGVIFVFHGSQKVFGVFGGHGIDGMIGYLTKLEMPLPTLNAYMASWTELVGGVLLIVGYGVRLVSIPLAITMLVAAFVAHPGSFDIQKGGMEYPLTLAVFLIGLVLVGAGRFSIGELFTRKGAPLK